MIIMNSYKVNIVLDRLICHDEGDGAGNAEPYIWAAFFKIDNDTAEIIDSVIYGRIDKEKPVQVHFSLGSHNNLSSQFIDIAADGMDAGDNIPIPETVGTWSTTLKPTSIPNPDNNNEQIPLPGVAGVLYMLLEEDNVTDFASSEGHKAFNQFFEDKLNYFFRSIDFPKIFDAAKTKKNPGENPDSKDLFTVILEKVKEFKKEIRDEGEAVVKSAVISHTWPWELLPLAYDKDDTLGDDLQIISNIELDETAAATKNFTITWGATPGQIGGGGLAPASDGIFTITGYFAATEIPRSFPPLTDSDPTVKGATIYMNVNFEGESRFLKTGKYSFGERVVRRFNISASPFDNAIDSIKVDSGYYAQVFKAPDFTGEMMEITHDTPVAWFDDNWRDQISSIIVGSLTERLG